MTRRICICLLALIAGLRFPALGAGDFESDLAETASSMRIWHMANGLPSDSVTATLQTRDGFLWIGTTAGLVRFDGVQFTPAPDTSSKNNITGVTALCEDSNGYLWIGTQENGLFELAGGKISHFAREEGLLSENVTSLAADNKGEVWVGSHSGLSLWTGGKFRSFTKSDGLPDDSVSGINVARSGSVWITTRVGMCRFINGHIVPYDFQTESQGRSPEYLGAYEDQRGNLWAFGDTYLINLTEGKRFNYFRSSEPASVRIWSLCEGHDGRLWIGTSGRGLFCFQENRFQPVILGENRWPYDVRSICEDREGNLWLGTSGGGLVQLRLESVFVLREGQGMPESAPAALAQDAEGRLYVGLERGGLWRGEAGLFDPIGGSDGSPLQNFISAIYAARDGTVWAGTLGDGLYVIRDGRQMHLTVADGLSGNIISSLCPDADGAIWAATGAGFLDRISGNEPVKCEAIPEPAGLRVTTMIPASGGGLWLGTQSGEILRFQSGSFKVAGIARTGTNTAVTALYEGGSQRLWVGTASGGLCCFSGSNRFNWSTNSGLPSVAIASVLEDNAGNLWLSTAAGIYRVNRATISMATQAIGVPLLCKLVSDAKTVPLSENALGGIRAIRMADGFLWFATAAGVYNVDSRRSDIEPPPFPVYIESAAVNGGSPVSLLQGQLWSTPETNRVFRTPVDLRSLEIHFTALNFSPGEVEFRHKLEGSDTDWVNDGASRSFRYTQLQRGNYRFRVSARLGDGPWLDAADVFRFVIPTPLYYQKWAIALYGIFAISLVAVTVRIISHRRLRRRLVRLEQEQALERERMRIARDMHDEMGSKLTKISFLSEHMQMDAESAGASSEKIESIAQASRDLLKTMDEIVWVVNPRNDTLENLVSYLSHHAVEYFQNTAVDCTIQMPPEIPHLPFSSETRHNLFLAFEETLNNVLKHSSASKVNITVNISARELELVVADNGRGFEAAKTLANRGESQSSRGGNGLRNMRQRLAAVGGQCVIASQPGAGTTVTMTVRLHEKRSP